MAARRMKLGFLTHGAGMTKWMWRQPGLRPDACLSFDFYLDLVKRAEAAKFDFFFVTDTPYSDPHGAPAHMAKLEPLTLLSALAGATSDIGLVGTASTSYCEPYNVARQFASLDLISNGRAGWNVVTTAVPAAALNYGLDEALTHAERYRRAAEFVGVVRGLWDSWEDAAFVYDRARNVYIDPARVHTLDHVGEHFRVRGPLDSRRSRQGQPVVFQAGASGDGKAFAARFGDAVFCGTRSLKEAQAYYADVRAAANGFGRPYPVMMAAISPIVGATDEEADRLYREMVELVSAQDAIDYLGDTFGGHDFSRYDPDAPFPDLDETVGAEAYKSTVVRFKSFARANNLSLKETARRIAIPRPQFAGNPEKVADTLQHWFEGGAADGFILGLGTPVHGIPAFIELVVPVLRRRGLFRTDYEGATLREHLGLAIPQNRYTAARAGA